MDRRSFLQRAARLLGGGVVFLPSVTGDAQSPTQPDTPEADDAVKTRVIRLVGEGARLEALAPGTEFKECSVEAH